MVSANNWLDAVTCGILKFRKSDQTGELVCEFANSEATALLGEAVGRTWGELSGMYSLPIHFSDEILKVPDGRNYKVSKQEVDAETVVFTLTDVSLERSAAKEMDDFLFIASHDLQEPLRKIVSFGERIARSKELLGDENSLYLSRMMNATGRMQKMLSGLLALSRVAQPTGQFEEVDIAEAVKEAFQAASLQIPTPNIRFSVGKLPAVIAIRQLIVQMFEEILVNAMRFQPPGNVPEIQVDSEVNLINQRVKIRVSDNGIGFDKENADRIFLLFNRLNGRAEYEGSGIGLAICRKIAEKHEGSIQAYSAPGKGTTIEVVLPMGRK